MDLPIFNRFSPGDKVEHVTAASEEVRDALSRVNNNGIGGGKLSLGSAAQNAFQKARDEARGLRRRAVVDHIVSPDEIRIMYCDNGDMGWVSPRDLEPLDAVTALADTLSSKSLKEQLGALEEEERAEKAKEKPAS